MPVGRRSGATHYVHVLIASIFVLILHNLLSNATSPSSQLIVSLLPVMMAAYFGGLGPGLFATFLCSLTLGPEMFHSRIRSAELAGFIATPVFAFIVKGCMISFLARALHLARQRDRNSSSNWHASQERFRQIVELADEGIWTTDESGRIDYANRRMCELLGYRAEELLHRTLSDLLANPLPRTLWASILHPNRSERRRTELRFRRKDGSILTALVSLTPIHDDRGQQVGTRGTFTDITRRKQDESALTRVGSPIPTTL